MNLIFCPYGRCGSTVLCTAIKDSCLSYDQTKVIYEPFTQFSDCHDLQKLENSKSKIDIISEKINVVKHIVHGHATEELHKYIISKSSKILFLYRENIFDQYVSFFMSITNPKKIFNIHRNHSIDKDDIESFYNQERPAIQIKEAIKDVKDIICLVKKWHSYIENFDNVITMSYENLYSDTNNFKKICNFFNLDLLNNDYMDILSKNNKMNNEETYTKVIPNYLLAKQTIQYGELKL